MKQRKIKTFINKLFSKIKEKFSKKKEVEESKEVNVIEIDLEEGDTGYGWCVEVNGKKMEFATEEEALEYQREAEQED